MFREIEKRIIFQTGGLIVVDKPADLPTSGRTLDDDDCLQYKLIQQQEQMIWAIHQLDADTSGLNLFTTEKGLVQKYKKALEQTNATKTYLAIVHGNPTWNTIEEKSPIGKIDARSLGVLATGKSAHSKFTVLSRSTNYALLKVNIYSGRTHQIRIHLSHLGFPLVGEEWYRNPPCTAHPRQALHCYEINLLTLNQKFTAPFPSDLYKLAQTLKLTLPAEFEREKS